MTVIALAGYGRSGKDTVADHLEAKHGFRRIAFADRLREATRAFDPIVGLHPKPNWTSYVPEKLTQWLPLRFFEPTRYADYLDAFGYHESKDNPEVRRALQRMGTEVGRQTIRDSVWVDIVRDEIIEDPTSNWVITDCRFPNEAKMVVDLMRDRDVYEIQSFVCFVRRPGFGPVNDHPSETAMDNWSHISDYTLHNGGTIEDLSAQVDAMVNPYIDAQMGSKPAAS